MNKQQQLRQQRAASKPYQELHGDEFLGDDMTSEEREAMIEQRVADYLNDVDMFHEVIGDIEAELISSAFMTALSIADCRHYSFNRVPSLESASKADAADMMLGRLIRTHVISELRKIAEREID